MKAMVLSLVTLFVSAFGTAITEWFKAMAREREQKALGRAEERADVEKESADAAKRMAEANARSRDDRSNLDRLRNGSA